MKRTGITPPELLQGFIDKYTPDIAAHARASLAKLRRLLPGAVEMAYDNYQFLAIGFGATERPSEAVLSLVLAPRKVSVCLTQGVRVADPDGLLHGGGNQVRFLALDSPATLDRADVQALLARAVALSPKAITGPRRLIIKSISAKQRPRRPTEPPPAKTRATKPSKRPVTSRPSPRPRAGSRRSR